MEISHLNSADIPRLFYLERKCLSFPWPEKAFENCCDKMHRTWKIEAGSEMVGFLITRYVLAEAEILRLTIAPKYRRKGCAEALLNTCFSDASAQGIETLFLEVRESNTPAITLYEKAGFKPFAARKAYYSLPNGEREDARIYQKRLVTK